MHLAKSIVAVIGGREVEPELLVAAEEVGRRIAEQGWVLISGGLGGVMEAASRGAANAGGTVVGILPQGDGHVANEFVQIPIATGLGYARNSVIAHSAEALVAIGGSYGTLSEIAMALNLGRPVIGIKTWEIPGVYAVADPAAAIEACKSRL